MTTLYYKVVDECQYSFSDLFIAAEMDIKMDGLSQEMINDLVTKACDKANWYWEDRTGTDGIIYRAFSPRRIMVYIKP